MTHAVILYIQVHRLDGVIILNFNICVGGGSLQNEFRCYEDFFVFL